MSVPVASSSLAPNSVTSPQPGRALAARSDLVARLGQSSAKSGVSFRQALHRSAPRHDAPEPTPRGERTPADTAKADKPPSEPKPASKAGTGKAHGTHGKKGATGKSAAASSSADEADDADGAVATADQAEADGNPVTAAQDDEGTTDFADDDADGDGGADQPSAGGEDDASAGATASAAAAAAAESQRAANSGNAPPGEADVAADDGPTAVTAAKSGDAAVATTGGLPSAGVPTDAPTASTDPAGTPGLGGQSARAVAVGKHASQTAATLSDDVAAKGEEATSTDPSASTRAAGVIALDGADLFEPFAAAGKADKPVPALPDAKTDGSQAGSGFDVPLTGGPQSTAQSHAAGGAASPSPLSPPDPEARFAEANHEKIVSGAKAELMPNGGTMKLKLDPPELGPLQVSLHMKDGIVTASFQAENADAARLLSHTMSDLRTSLEASGITVDKLHVQQAPKDETGGGAGQQKGDGGGSRTFEQQQDARREQQRKDMVQRLWDRLAGKGPLDLVA